MIKLFPIHHLQNPRVTSQTQLKSCKIKEKKHQVVLNLSSVGLERAQLKLKKKSKQGEMDCLLHVKLLFCFAVMWEQN